MEIVIVGGGKVGSALCLDLAAEKHNIVLIDVKPEVVENLIDISDISGIVGSCTSVDIQLKAGVETCDVYIAVTESDEINIIASIIARKLGAKTTLARVRNPEYSENFGFVRENLGISMMVNPELETARAIARSIRFPSSFITETFANGRVQMVEVRIEKGSAFDGMQLSNFRKNHGSALVCVVKRGDGVHIPGGSFTLKEGDLLHVTGLVKDLDDVYKAAGRYTRKIRSVMIIGGSRITRYLLKILEQTRIAICVIDQDGNKARRLADDFPRVKVIVGDGTDQAVLEEQNIASFDCFVALTGIDEENLVTSLYAAHKKVPKIVTKINRKPLLHIFRDQGLQTIITPARLVSDIITRYIRSLNSALGSKVEAMYRIADGRAEALQFEVLKKSRATGIPLKKLKLKKGILIAYIIRQNQLIFPTGDDEIHPGDHLIAVTTECNFDEIDDLLER
ncbi:MAG: Trk system potassium transporter TrkA [Clostridiales bacterium]|nr:Trk system potassium transporter TrkA [Clostridiales bacterium]